MLIKRVNREDSIGENSFIREQNLEKGWRTKDNASSIQPKISIKASWIDRNVKFRGSLTRLTGTCVEIAYRKVITRVNSIVLEVVPATKKAAGEEYCSFRGYGRIVPGEKDELL